MIPRLFFIFESLATKREHPKFFIVDSKENRMAIETSLLA